MFFRLVGEDEMTKHAIFLTALCLLGFMACSPSPQAAQTQAQASGAPSAEEPTNPLKESSMPQKVLVAYFSYSGNTAAVARQIAAKTGGDLYEIRPQASYPAQYDQLLDQAKSEIRSGFHPPLQEPLPDLAGYDVIFIGSPNWWGTYAPAAGAFLARYDWSGKQVAPFFTHGGGGLQNCAKDMQKLLSSAQVLPAAAFRGRADGAKDAELDAWLSKIGY